MATSTTLKGSRWARVRAHGGLGGFLNYRQLYQEAVFNSHFGYSPLKTSHTSAIYARCFLSAWILFLSLANIISFLHQSSSLSSPATRRLPPAAHVWHLKTKFCDFAEKVGVLALNPKASYVFKLQGWWCYHAPNVLPSSKDSFSLFYNHRIWS